MQVTLHRPRPHLGQVVSTVPQPVRFTRVATVERRLEATGLIFGGLFSATSLLLFALGHDKAGYMLGISSALWGAVLGAIRVFGQQES